MSLINQALLYGLAFAAIPLLLHLLMKAKPKKVLFPALRLIQMRKKTNTRRLRLRHFWLLLLRTLLLAVLVLAVARPSLPAANYGLSALELGTLIGILVVAAGVYQWLQRRWKQQRLASHELRYRRTLLRGGTGGGIALLVLLLVGLPYGRRISAEISGESASDLSQSLPVAAVFLFDTSLSMEYRLENKTRLDEAIEIASAHLSSLPAGSRVAIADISNDRDMVFQADLISARARIESLKAEPGSRDVNDRLSMAFDLQSDDRQRLRDERGYTDEDSDEFIREVYVFTDLARSAWRLGNSSLRAELDQMPWLHTYLIDLSVPDPINCGITNMKLSQQSLTRGAVMEIDATLIGSGINGLRTAEIYLNDRGGTPVRQDQRTVKMEPGVAGKLTFPVLAPDGPFVQGEIRLMSSDPFAADDVRFFTVGLNRPPRVLLIGEDVEEANYLRYVLAPPGLVRQNRSRHDVTYRSLRDFQSEDLENFDIVCLINLRDPRPDHWTALREFVSRGGGLAVFLGRGDLRATSYNIPEAQEVLPAELVTAVRFFKGPFIVDLQNSEHPLFRRIADSNDDRAEFSAVQYTRAWSVQAAENARVLATYNDERQLPAWLERPLGEGRTILFTNGMDFIGDDGRAWSDLANSWIFARISYQLMHYLSHHADGVFNWISGQDAIVRFDREQVQEKYLLRKPSLQQLPGPIPQDRNYVVLTEVDPIGHYRFASGQGADAFVSGFSVNSDDRESQFDQITDSELNVLLGEERYSRARHIEELDRAVQSSRLGREIFPLLMVLVVILFAGEHFVANRFYDESAAATAEPDRTRSAA